MFCFQRIEILKKIRQDELDRRKVEERRRLERGLKDTLPGHHKARVMEEVRLDCF